MRLFLVLTAALLLTACSKLTMTNYDRLERGMTYEEVVGIIGNPDKCDEVMGTRTCIWGDEQGTYIKAGFIGQKAVLFSHKNLN